MSRDDILLFLEKVDHDFPVSLSSKTQLHSLADKYFCFGTLCCEYSDGKIIGMVAGYIEHTPSDLGYISLVALCKETRGRGVASKLLKQFLGKASEKGLRGVHVYTHCTNFKAIDMYKKNGFILYTPENEPRSDDIHFIYLF